MQMYALFRVKGKISEKKIKEISTRLFFERFFSFLCIILLPLPLYKTLNMDRRTFFKTTLFAAGGMAVGGLTSCEEPAKTYDEKTGMTYRRLGRTGIDVSVVALGCEGFSKKSAEEVRAEFDHAINRGVNFLDLYSSNPDLRSNIGYALKGRRNKFVVQGHIGSTWENGQYLRTRDVEKVKVAFEDLLERLGTNYIDVGMIHYVDERADYDTVMNGPFFDYVKWLKKKRKIRSIGLSTHSVEIATLAAESGIVDVLMFSLSPGYDLTFENGQIVGISPERAQLYELCAKNGVAIDVMKAFGGGNLLNEKDSPFGKAFSPVQCIEYALSRPGVAAVMCGCKGVEEMDADLAWCRATRKQRDFINVLAGVTSADWKGSCMYCTHCAPCQEGIDVASVNKYLKLALAQDEVPETVRDHYNLLAHHASECAECGKCERRCPFDVKIISNMHKAVEVFGI